MAAVKLEFDVQLNCDSCCQAVIKALSESAVIESVTCDLKGQSVVVQTSLPSSVVQKKIEETGRRAILKGLGPVSHARPKQRLGTAVCALSGPNNVLGVVRFLEVDEQSFVIDGTVDGLTPGEHGLHVYEFGDISSGCERLGNHYNPTNSSHGGPADTNKHAGDLGNIVANEIGRATFRLEISGAMKVHDFIGRSLGISGDRDDLGLGNNQHSKINGNSGNGIACGIIARSPGLFENPKRICACSGQTIWEERDEALKYAAESSTN